MKTGLENKRNVFILGGLVLVLIIALWYFIDAVFVGGGPPPAARNTAPATTTTAAPAAVQNSSEAAGGRAARKVPALASLDPTLHPELMAGAELLEYNGSGRNIFSMSSAPPPKVEKAMAPARPTAVAQAVPQGPPPPPPIELKFFGYSAQGGARRAFLLHGDDVFIASEGDVVDHHYKIVHINPLSIQVTDLLYNNTQTLPLTQS